MRKTHRKTVALFALVLAAILLLAFALWRVVWLVELASFLIALSLAIGIGRRSWLWYGIVLFGLSTSAYQAWSKTERFWASLYVVTIAYGLTQIFRRIYLARQVQQRPLTKGEFTGHYGVGSQRVVYYSYEVEGGYYSGCTSSSSLQLPVKSDLDVLKGRPAFVRYRPNRPEISVILWTDQAELPA